MTTPPTAATTPLTMTNHTMTTAYQQGQVTPLSPVITEFVYFNGDWWTIDPPDAWIRITDDTFAKFLDQQYYKMKSTIDLSVRH
ncbi:hypothetical protein [Stackebrandtia nassauensis]|uniref:Uncharacterized protein n=1 Tax=Stackebrandtia nassauensis (strain DSM 44728 / CIP 108903 / NRRL B-16338 / NBRC 102104 / LLR-40K-21) TaxID=446470 RepID=D3PVV0_STANL|nr:hypothetical protein [Stackebrandtia nassauensis]ADD45071.1 hypothetical protein Snas_5439 [Stackebrandtia nassauensis DSM 44728]